MGLSLPLALTSPPPSSLMNLLSSAASRGGYRPRPPSAACRVTMVPRLGPHIEASPLLVQEQWDFLLELFPNLSFFLLVHKSWLAAAKQHFSIFALLPL